MNDIQVAKLFADSSTIAITSFISPYRADRALARNLHTAPLSSPPSSNKVNETGQETVTGLPFIEVHIDIPVSEAEKRDPKGLYKKARAGEIKEFTGISAPYEEPEDPEVVIRSHEVSVEEAVRKIVVVLEDKGLLVRPE